MCGQTDTKRENKPNRHSFCTEFINLVTLNFHKMKTIWDTGTLKMQTKCWDTGTLKMQTGWDTGTSKMWTCVDRQTLNRQTGERKKKEEK